MRLRDKFIKNNIPYDNIDPEMIEILDVLNFGLGIKTKFCCIGHSPKEPTSIMFGDKVTDEEIFMILSVVDWNVGTSGVKGTRLSKWARMLYQPYYKPPHYPKTNWILKIDGRDTKEERLIRLNKITEGLKELCDFDKDKLG